MSGTLAIPASAIVAVTPSVISAGGNALDLNGLMLTTSPRVPVGTVAQFPSQTAVANFFGTASSQAALAGVYFLGFDNSNVKPGNMLWAQYNTAPVNAWMRGGSLSALTLTQLQSITPGVMTITIDGTLRTSSSINLSAATSFSNAAEIITLALGTTGPAGANFTGSLTGQVLTVTAVASGTIAVGQELRGTGVTLGNIITSLGTGTGGIGTYNLSTAQTLTSQNILSNTPTVTWDAITSSFYVQSATTGASSTITVAGGAIATSLGLTTATGATLSQGAVAAVPATFMSNIVVQTQNWAAFATDFDPDGGSGNAVKQAFAAWSNQTVDRYEYVVWDTDITPTQSQTATTSLGYILNQKGTNGCNFIYSPTQGPTIAAFQLGFAASIDFTQTNGRVTAAYRTQAGIAPDVVNRTVATNLIANGYNFYGIYATGNDQFTGFVPGQISGQFDWVDSYLDQIWLNNQFQLALIGLLFSAYSIPYNQAGYSLIRAALLDPINQGLAFGAFRSGVTLSNLQIAEVNNAAGTKIDDVLSTQGWFLQIKDALPQVRQVRGSPPITFWYVDGQSVQTLNMASIEVQ